MAVELPNVVADYVKAANAHDAEGMLACFADTAEVRDESRTHRGKSEIQAWLAETIEKYRFHFEPLAYEGDAVGGTLSVKISGTFDGSPVTLDFRFQYAAGRIASLVID